MSNWLKIIFLARLIASRKITPRKLFNLFRVKLNYYLRSSKASPYPAVLVVEPTNNCQLRCTKCRTLDNKIFDYEFNSHPGEIPIGRIDRTAFEKTINEFGKHLMIASLYMQGEPLLSKDIYNMIRYCTDRNVATLVGSNGMLCGGKNAEKIVEAGLDILKIAVSGFTQETYERYHRKGDIELIKNNLRDLALAKTKSGSKLLIHVEYIVFDYNKSEYFEFKDYCQSLGAICTIRYDNWTSHEEAEEDENKTWYSKRLCDWIWGVFALNYDGTVIPCCVFSKTSKPVIFGDVAVEQNLSKNIWNGSSFVDFRNSHLKQGRVADPICATCQLEGLGLQAEKRELQPE